MPCTYCPFGRSWTRRHGERIIDTGADSNLSTIAR